jgi:isochorismate pyruvate lyase
MSTDSQSAIQRTFSGAPWESKVGYCRAIRAGNIVAVTGTASVGENGKTHAPGDAYAQAKRCLEIIEKAITSLSCERRHIIRTRMFVTDIKRWQEYGRAHAELPSK